MAPPFAPPFDPGAAIRPFIERENRVGALQMGGASLPFQVLSEMPGNIRQRQREREEEEQRALTLETSRMALDIQQRTHQRSEEFDALRMEFTNPQNGLTNWAGFRQAALRAGEPWLVDQVNQGASAAHTAAVDGAIKQQTLLKGYASDVRNLFSPLANATPGEAVLMWNAKGSSGRTLGQEINERLEGYQIPPLTSGMANHDTFVAYAMNGLTEQQKATAYERIYGTENEYNATTDKQHATTMGLFEATAPKIHSQEDLDAVIQNFVFKQVTPAFRGFMDVWGVTRFDEGWPDRITTFGALFKTDEDKLTIGDSTTGNLSRQDGWKLAYPNMPFSTPGELTDKILQSLTPDEMNQMDDYVTDVLQIDQTQMTANDDVARTAITWAANQTSRNNARGLEFNPDMQTRRYPTWKTYISATGKQIDTDSSTAGPMVPSERDAAGNPILSAIPFGWVDENGNVVETFPYQQFSTRGLTREDFDNYVQSAKSATTERPPITITWNRLFDRDTGEPSQVARQLGVSIDPQSPWAQEEMRIDESARKMALAPSMAIEQYIKQFVWKHLARQNADNPDEPMMPIDNTSYYTFMSSKNNRDWLKETAAPLQVYAGLNWDVLPLLWEFEDDVLYASRSEPFTYHDLGYDTSMKMGEQEGWVTKPVPNNPDDFNRLFASGLIDEHGNWLTPLGADQPIDWDRFRAGTTVLQQ